MKSKFPGYFRPTDEEFKKLWCECFFVFDTNALLNLYRYSPESRTEFIHIVEKVRDRCWIPHQVGIEFFRRRLSEIRDQQKAYDETIAQLEELEAVFSTERHPFLCEQKLQRLKEVIAECKNELGDRKNELRELVHNDSIKVKLAEIFEGRVGSEYDKSKLTELYQEGTQRNEKKIPPGYCDDKKDDDRKHGDLILWCQLLDEAKQTARPAIFVTAESKEDWWLKHNGEILGPRPELVEEARRKADIQFWAYKPHRFMELARQYLQAEVKQQAVDEIENVAVHLAVQRTRFTALWQQGFQQGSPPVIQNEVNVSPEANPNPAESLGRVAAVESASP